MKAKQNSHWHERMKCLGPSGSWAGIRGKPAKSRLAPHKDVVVPDQPSFTWEQLHALVKYNRGEIFYLRTRGHLVPVGDDLWCFTRASVERCVRLYRHGVPINFGGINEVSGRSEGDFSEALCGGSTE